MVSMHAGGQHPDGRLRRPADAQRRLQWQHPWHQVALSGLRSRCALQRTPTRSQRLAVRMVHLHQLDGGTLFCRWRIQPKSAEAWLQHVRQRATSPSPTHGLLSQLMSSKKQLQQCRDGQNAAGALNGIPKHSQCRRLPNEADQHCAQLADAHPHARAAEPGHKTGHTAEMPGLD